MSAYIAGGTEYAKGKAKTISGITTDDATGKITVNLVAPFAPIVDIFALAGTAPVPPNTPMKNLASTGTIGDGPYKWGAITAGQSYTLVKNPKFDVPGLPRGHADTIVFKVNSNVLANAEQVLNNQADVFDPGDTLPASILQQVKSQASRPVQADPDQLDVLLLVRGHPEAVQQHLRPPGGAGGARHARAVPAGQRLPEPRTAT